MTVTIAVALQDRPSAAPLEGIWISDYKLVNRPTFTAAISAVSSLVFSLGGTPSFFALVAEMRDPRDYTKSLLICQSLIAVLYITIGCVVYYYCGTYVATPALGSAGPLLKRIAYGLALPGLGITTILLAHVRESPLLDCWRACTN
jgi:amino acid permease